MKKNFLLALFILFISFAKSQETKWTPEESMKFKSISQVNMSEDGKYITYVVREGIMEEEPWRRYPGGGIMEEKSCRRNHAGGILEDESWRRNHGGATMEEESWWRKH